MDNLQKLAGKWSYTKFPKASPVEVCLKATEELGETAKEVLGDYSNNSFRDRGGHAPEEAADVVVCLLILMERYYPGRSLYDEVAKKLAILTDVNSGHRGAIEIDE